MNKVIKVLMEEIKSQHQMRLEEDECGGSEIDESFDILKAGMIDTLLEQGSKDFKLLDDIQNF